MQEIPPSALTPFVFSDPAGKRWPRLRLTLLVLGVLAFLATVLFVQTLFVAPQMRVPFSLRQLKGQLKALQRANPAGQASPASLLWQKFGAAKQAAKKNPGPTPVPPAKPRKKAPPNEVRLAFYTNGDPYSYTSLEEHASLITHLCPEWITVMNGLGDIQIDPDSRLPKFCASKGIALMPLLTNLVGDTWQPEAVENLAHGPADRQEKFFTKVIAALRDAKAKGVVIDWEQIDPAYKKDLTTFIDKFCDALHNDDKELWLTVQAGQELDYIDFDELSDNVDRFVASLFDETSDIDPPGPLGSRSWFEGWLHVLLEGSDSKQWIIALGSYGYDWTIGGKKAELISFPEAMSRAHNADIESAEVVGPNYNPYFYFEDGDKEHAVWFLDVTTFLNELREVRDNKAGGFALYRLGTEDPAIWDALAVPRDFKIDNQTRGALETLKGTDTITDVGEGEIVTVDENRADGQRTLTVDADGYLTAKYTQFPEFPTLYHQGAGGEHQVAITFDDGPDPDWTPKILDILKAANVKAAFFLVGVNAEKYPGLVRRIVNEGHEIGNHTYYHPNLALAWPEHVRLELNATQLLLETITGRATTLFRPPYAADTQPSQMSELTPLQIAQELNYLVVLENIDPQDWAKPGADIILQRIKQQRRDGSIILLHDAGGDRSQTVAALPRILDWLHTRGDTIVPLSTLLGTSRDAVMPPLQTANPSLNRLVSSTGFRIYHALEAFLWAFMIVATALVVVRTLVVIWLAYRFRRLPPSDFAEQVSIVIAAYNEGKVIAGTLRSLLATDYKGELEIIVVDDGSIDQTGAEVERVADVDPRVHLLRQENRGKAHALERALSAVRHGIVVFVDADTHFQSDTLRLLVEPFADKEIGAVSGHAKVGNLRTFIARCQSLEYTCGFNLDRRAYTRWNCITVVPGAISAIRKSAIDEAGGLSLQTLAEDTDLTLALHKDRQRIVYAPQAIAWTEAPESVRALARQRFRWAYGTLQCLWKHRDMVFNWNYRALGWFSLPSVWFFQIILVAVTPIVDLFLLASLPFGAWSAVLPFVITFLSMDVILATLACILEKDPIRHAWRILPMRLIYRPMLSYCIWKAILRAIKGAWVSWGKLERTASVPVRAQSDVRGLMIDLFRGRTIDGFLILGIVFASVSCDRHQTQSAIDPNGPCEIVIPEHGAYTGAFIDFGEEEDTVNLEEIEDFEQMVGKHQAIIASSSYWGEQNFPTANLNVLWRHGSLPLVFWSPWDKPYVQNRGPDKFNLYDIIAGTWDAYIDKWADAAREFGHPMIVVFANEMNGEWFPWSGKFYGGDEWDDDADNWKGPETFRRAYRHVVDRVRARGAANIKWMFHVNNYSSPVDTWNFAPSYYPGSDYVDWLGMSVYGQQFKDEPNPDIYSLVDWPYQELCGLDPNKPVMIAEWATGEFPFEPGQQGMHKPEWIKQGLELFRTRYPRVKAAVYWHERWQNVDQSYSNLRVNSSVESLQAYRDGLANPYWLGNLILRALPKNSR